MQTMTTPPRDSLEERAENKTKDFEYTVICPESEKTAFRDGYIWGARLELQGLRDEIKSEITGKFEDDYDSALHRAVFLINERMK